MVVHKKADKQVSGVPASATPPLESPVEEKRKSFTQVVEVVEEVPQETTTEEYTPSVEPSIEEEPSHGQPQETTTTYTEPSYDTPEVTHTEVSEPNKKRDLVDELFQKQKSEGNSVVPEITMHTQKRMKPIVLWAIIVIVACVVIGTSLIFLTKGSEDGFSIITAPTPTVSPVTDTATPSATALNRTDISIQVLNGGGVVGAASKMKTVLEEAGYTVKATGNAESYTYTSTEILIKSSKKAYLTMLENDLKETYSLGTSAGTLKDSDTYDVQIIVGKE